VLSEETWNRVFRLLVEEGIESEVDLVPYGDAVPPCGPWDTQPTYAPPCHVRVSGACRVRR
jgi:hypothetical protein